MEGIYLNHYTSLTTKLTVIFLSCWSDICDWSQPGVGWLPGAPGSMPDSRVLPADPLPGAGPHEVRRPLLQRRAESSFPTLHRI